MTDFTRAFAARLASDAPLVSLAPVAYVPSVPQTPRAPILITKRTEEREMRWHGVIVVREFDDGITDDELALMRVGGRKRKLARGGDLPTHDGHPHFILSERERKDAERLLNRQCRNGFEVAMPFYPLRFHNVACNVGRSVLLNFIANAGGLTGVQYFAVGTGALPSGVAASDTQLASEYFRKALSLTTLSGNQIDLSCAFGSTDANTTYTEAGIFGNGATGTANSGTLFAHAPYAYVKTSGIVLTNDYYVNLS